MVNLYFVYIFIFSLVFLIENLNVNDNDYEKYKDYLLNIEKKQIEDFYFKENNALNDNSTNTNKRTREIVQLDIIIKVCTINFFSFFSSFFLIFFFL